ncbi:MAG: exopolysaccharide biosynthesis polyprenyl glycosylphosphotransferase [Pseudomonadales bacterium]|nr:exopolysaccharide biosynthesis polyprenyl glycosylphosphotransferase [Pseudomonadales bacterium]
MNHKVSEVAGVYTLDLNCGGMDEVNLFVKKMEDLILSVVILLAISPLLLMISAGVKLTSRGPVLFKQQRNGIDGKKIKVYKFRTMYVGTDESVGFVEQAKKNDSRITPFGALLRRTSLDELPQFYNVLQGRMSVVGPRPHALSHNEHYKEVIASYMQRHKVKPGITGWAQVHGLRGETDTVDKMQRRVEYDLFYIENWSIWLDIKIVFLTMFKGFNNDNAY